jgi:hypothetical protein
LELNLPPGYHFLPTDDELVVHYLRPRLANANHRLPLPIFVNERILNYHPDILIGKLPQIDRVDLLIQETNQLIFFIRIYLISTRDLQTACR